MRPEQNTRFTIHQSISIRDTDRADIGIEAPNRHKTNLHILSKGSFISLDGRFLQHPASRVNPTIYADFPA
jgi:hypothetical protein